MENMTTKTTLIFMDQSGKVIRTKDLTEYPCILFTSNEDLRVYTDLNEPLKDPFSITTKKIHVSGNGIGSILEAREIRPGAYVLYTVLTRYLWIREDPGYEGKDLHYYLRADDNLPAGAHIKIEVD